MSAPRRQIRKTSQAARILKYLQAGNTLTVREAFILFDTMTLAQRIQNIEEAGHKIKVDYKSVDKQTKIAIYSLDNTND